VRHRREQGTNPQHWVVQLAEQALLDNGGDLGPDAAVPRILMTARAGPTQPAARWAHVVINVFPY
jgi:hypothetical protein